MRLTDYVQGSSVAQILPVGRVKGGGNSSDDGLVTLDLSRQTDGSTGLEGKA